MRDAFIFLVVVVLPGLVALYLAPILQQRGKQ
jgi:hypothetical protein